MDKKQGQTQVKPTACVILGILNFGISGILEFQNAEILESKNTYKFGEMMVWVLGVVHL